MLFTHLRIFTSSVIGIALFSLLFSPPSRATGETVKRASAGFEAVMHKSGDRLLDAIRSMSPEDTVAVWIFFRDEDLAASSRSGDPVRAGYISPRAYRRIMRRAPGAVIDGHRPVRAEHIEGIRGNVLRIRRSSRYLNAVSADVSVAEIAPICTNPFVERLRRVAVYRRVDGNRMFRHVSGEAYRPADDPLRGLYGESLDQVDQIQAIELLEMGYNGSGSVAGENPVLVCILDTGFNLGHEALENVHVVAEWDFVQNDSVTSNQAGDIPTQERHGTTVLGAIAGYHEGDLVGPAWGADFLLAKTEIEGQEIMIEEDYWIAAVEWADSAGADIVTSSLGYVDWYDPEDINGNTALCTVAADIAVSRGIVVVNSAGNLGPSGMLTPPADGHGVIAVGAVYRDGTVVSFSSRGPTADDRIKPDLVALGYRVHSVESGTWDGYDKYSGTSMAAPLVAGLCALILEIHPDWSPLDMRDSLTATATRSHSPDNSYGYGIPQGLAASGITATGIPESTFFSIGYPNPFRETTAIDLLLPTREPVTVRVYDCRGSLVRTLIRDRILKWRWTLTWDGTNDAGRRVAGGVYFIDITSLHTRKTSKVLYIP
jgi:serine protease AprX